MLQLIITKDIIESHGEEFKSDLEAIKYLIAASKLKLEKLPAKPSNCRVLNEFWLHRKALYEEIHDLERLIAIFEDALNRCYH